jgi:hypothetical protein
MEGNPLIDINVTTFVVFDKVHIKLELGSSSGGTIKQDLKLIDTVISFCKLGSTPSNVMTKIFMEKLKKSSNFQLKCPLQKVSFFNRTLNHF